MSKGTDRVLSAGNLTMGQVGSMFQRLITEVDKTNNLDVVRRYGMPIYYSDESAARNPLLRNTIQDFIAGHEVTDTGAHIPVADNLSFLLVKANKTINTGGKFERAEDSDLSTHWTVLNLRKNNGKIEVRYADSIGSHDGKDKIPQTVKDVLSQCGIKADEQQRRFTSNSQTQANCGYMTVWHALKMHGIAVLENPEQFVVEERETLMKEIGQAAIFSPIPKSVDVRPYSNSKTPRSLHNPTRLFSNATESLGAAGEDLDDSSDEETVKTKVFGSVERGSKRRVGGYDLESQWQEFLVKENVFLDAEVLRRIDKNLDKLATKFFSDGASVTVNLENGETLKLNKDNILTKVKTSKSWLKHIREKVLGEWIKDEIIPQYRQELNEYYKRAFTAQAFGIGLLYSQKVEELYHSDGGLKEQFFANPDSANELRNLAQRAFKYAISTAVEKQCDIFLKGKTKDERQLKTEKQRIVQDVLSRASTELNQACEEAVKTLSSKKLTAGNLKQEISHIIKSTLQDTTSRKGLSDIIEQEFLAAVSHSGLSYLDERRRKTLNVTKDSPSKDLMKPFENILWKKIGEDRWQLLIGINDKSPLSSNDLRVIGFERKGDGATVNSSDKKLPKDLKERLSNAAANLYQNHLSRTYSDRSLTTPESDSKKLSHSAKSFSSNEYLESLTPKHLATTMFRGNLESGLNLYLKRNNLSRRELPKLHTFESDNYEQEFANERVVRRGITRTVREQKDNFLGSTESAPKRMIELAYKVGEDHEGVKEKSTIQMAKGASDPSLSEFTDITRTAGFSSYVEIFSKIKSVSKKFGISNKRMISLVRNGPDQDLEDELLEFSAVEVNNLKLFLSGFRRLFLGLESRRNPAQRVLSQMMFDILEDKNIDDWKPYLAGESATHADKKMPMMRVGAVPIARQKNAKMSDFMPWHYTYSGNEEEKKEEEGTSNPEKQHPINSLREMVIKESRICSEWLTHKKISPEFTEEALLIASEEWYGIEMDGVIYGANNGQERSAAQVALKKWTEKTTEDPSKKLGDGDYVLMTKILERSDFKPSEEEFDEIGEAAQARLEYLRSQDSPPEYREKIFLKNLAQKKLFNFDLLDSEEGAVIKGAKTGGYGNLLSWMIPATLDQEDIWQDFEEAAVMVAWKEWFNSNPPSYRTHNSSESAIQTWLSKIEEDEELHECGIGGENYELLTKALEISSFTPSKKMAAEISQTLYSRLTKAHQEHETIDEQEELFYKTLARQNMLNFEHVGDDYDNLISWVISMKLDSVAEEMIPKISTEFLSTDLIDGVTVLSIAARNGNEKICKLLISKGVPIDEQTKESKFYKANEDIFVFDMPAMKSEIDDISKHISDLPSNASTPLSHSKLSSRSSSRSGSISN